ncbi:DUF4097 family beta strand repeat-containing protein [Marinoscillum furvescens]|uniref:Adhesin n=1 Tax=Marinoscillum furvescens DSM 4134 TaxID=1122208 RepID=A0A3D9L119_MARFU|nr:hypothetical protein [Marinoscillum furvescens]RED97445.1 hypothetical protein C7460_11254 [Marinoscillum furvescens DSM 4134]
MKKQYIVSVILLMVTSMTMLASALDERSKRINKTFTVRPNTTVEVTNRYGKIHVNVWNKPTCEVKVEVVVEGRSAQRAKELLDQIDVEFDEGDAYLEMKTEYDGVNTKRNENFEVNYTINLPANNPLEIENHFGDVYLDSRTGITEVLLKYGQIKAGDFTGFLDLTLEFGGGSIGNLSSAELKVKYSELRIASAQDLDFEQQFSDIKLDAVNELEMESKYGDVELGVVGRAEIDAQFSGFTIDELKDYMDMTASYVSGFKINKVSSAFSEIDISGKFSDYTLVFPEKVAADLEARFSFSDLRMDRDDADVYYREKDTNRSEYKARLGGGSSTKKITVKSSYGDLTIR